MWLLLLLPPMWRLWGWQCLRGRVGIHRSWQVRWRWAWRQQHATAGERQEGGTRRRTVMVGGGMGTFLILAIDWYGARQVWRENMTFFKDKHLFAKAHSRFLWHLLKAEAGTSIP